MGESLINTQRLWSNLVPAGVSTGLFILASLPKSYEFTWALEQKVATVGDLPPCPATTLSARLLHMLLFFGLLYGVSAYLESYKEEAKRNTNSAVAKQAFYRTLLFFVLTSPESYQLTGKLLSGLTAGQNPCPTVKGIFVHALVFLVIVTLTLYFPPDQASERFSQVQQQ